MGSWVHGFMLLGNCNAGKGHLQAGEWGVGSGEWRLQQTAKTFTHKGKPKGEEEFGHLVWRMSQYEL